MPQTKAKTVRRMLVVDDHAAARESVADVLRHMGYDVTGASSAREALGLLDRQEFHVIVTDLQMPGMDGLEFIRQIHHRRLLVQVIMVTAHATIASAVEAMRYGAFDYLEKPFNATQLEATVKRALERGQLLAPDEKTENPQFADTAGLVGESRVMQMLRSRLAQVAPTDETVLICGESGTGKELVARAIHAHSRRASGPLVSLNCPALSAQLTESELFGHKRGAFTGAESDRTGRFEAAHGGSILLDEVTEIDLTLQAKLLRVLQERSFERVGATDTIAVDVRVIATTNRDLHAEVKGGCFREDLYFRLAVVPIVLPPLRERGGDVLDLADHFLAQAAERLNRTRVTMEPNARELLTQYHWPGNVRELQNIITRACVLNQGAPISAQELSPWLHSNREFAVPQEDSLAPADVTLDEMERRLIVATLKRCDGHRVKAAEKLGIGLRTLSGKLRAYGYAPREKDFANAE